MRRRDRHGRRAAAAVLRLQVARGVGLVPGLPARDRGQDLPGRRNDVLAAVARRRGVREGLQRRHVDGRLVAGAAARPLRRDLDRQQHGNAERVRAQDDAVGRAPSRRPDRWDRSRRPACAARCAPTRGRSGSPAGAAARRRRRRRPGRCRAARRPSRRAASARSGRGRDRREAETAATATSASAARQAVSSRLMRPPSGPGARRGASARAACAGRRRGRCAAPRRAARSHA